MPYRALTGAVFDEPVMDECTAFMYQWIGNPTLDAERMLWKASKHCQVSLPIATLYVARWRTSRLQVL